MITCCSPLHRAAVLRHRRGTASRSAFGAVQCGPHVGGSQAFSSTTAFNANIGSWNTALVSNMNGVCDLRPLGITQHATEVRMRSWPCASSRSADVG
jgi:hypothetical protein